MAMEAEDIEALIRHVLEQHDRERTADVKALCERGRDTRLKGDTR